MADTSLRKQLLIEVFKNPKLLGGCEEEYSPLEGETYVQYLARVSMAVVDTFVEEYNKKSDLL